MVGQVVFTAYFLYFIIFASASDIKNVTQLNREIRQISGCVLPDHPENGRWNLLGGIKDPGDIVPANSVLEFECDSNYKLTKNKHVTCSSGWSPEEMPECQVLCPPQTSTSVTFLQCFDETAHEIDCKEATHGSYMKYNCTDFYEPIPGQRKTINCVNGAWDIVTPECRPICGHKNDEDANSKNLAYPWVAAIYRKENGQYINVCGATIIHRKAVLTAGDCVTDDYGFGLPVDNYEVAAAKLYNTYGDSRDEDAQYLKVFEFIVNPRYKFSKRLLADIAVVITQLSFQLNSLVRPICINNLNTFFLQPGDIGEMARWGAADRLNSITLPNRPDDYCVRKVPSDWAENYNMADKMCFGSPERTINICKRDSGSGLYFKNIFDNRYYVRGIVNLASSAVTENICNNFENAYYTNISVYYEFIDRAIAKVNWCRLPNYPTNGRWQLQKLPNKSPGDIVSPFDIIEVSCDKRYELNIINTTVDCETLLIIPPSCKATSPANKKTQLVNKIKPKPTTVQLADQTTPTSISSIDEISQESKIKEKPTVSLDSSRGTTNQFEDQSTQTSTASIDKTNEETNKLEVQTTQTTPASLVEINQENQVEQKPAVLFDSSKEVQTTQTTQTSPVSLDETNQENQIGQKTTVPLDSRVATNQVEAQTTQTSITATDETNQENQITQKSIAPLDSSRITTNQMAEQTTQTSTEPLNSSEGQCGGKVNGSSSETLDSDGEFTKHVDYPWLVIIYSGKSYKGHGSIISRKLVITGARVLTVWNVWTLLNYKEVTVGVGKYYKFINDPRDAEAKYYNAETIYVSDKFNGIAEGVHNDIGFVVVSKPIEYGKWIQPICVEGVNDIVLRAEDILEIAGWVNTDNVAVATPITNEIIVKKLGQCLTESSPLGDYLSPDAICGGPVDKTTCIGHSGSGLVYKNPKNNRYYLNAMYSFGVTSCVGKNNLYISIKYHYNYVMEQIKKYN